MSETINIKIGYSFEEDIVLIDDFKKDLPKEFVVNADENKSYFDGSGNSSEIFISVLEWFTNNIGAYLLLVLLDRIKDLIIGHIKIRNNASIKIIIGKGKDAISCNIENVSNEEAMRALDKFIKIAKDKIKSV